MQATFRLVHTVLAAILFMGSASGWAGERPENVMNLGELGKTAVRPKPIKQSEPVFPYSMQQAGLTGSVVVEFIIAETGNVTNAYVVESNNPWFERPAIDAVLGWKFTPAKMDGHPVKVSVKQLIVFEFDWGGKPPQLWKISKGKDHNKLPPELQWDEPPQPINTQFPVYPYEQLKAAVGGQVRVSYLVGPDGRILRALLLNAATPELGHAVLAMIDAWQFRAAKKKDGTPAYANLSSEYMFQPKGRGDVPVSDEARQILRDLEKKPDSIATLAGLDRPLHPLSRRPPVFPTAMEKAETGEALIEFYVDKKGDAQLPRIVSASAPEFGYAAIQAVATWRFEPPVKNKQRVVVRVQIPIEFKRKSGKP
jgi:TonB family protein